LSLLSGHSNGLAGEISVFFDFRTAKRQASRLLM